MFVHASSEALSFLRLLPKDPSVDSVLKQLQFLSAAKINPKDKNQGEISRSTNEIYAFLQRRAEASEQVRSHVVSALRGTGCILVSGQFFHAERLALAISQDCAPYLYRVPDTLRAYEYLLRAIGVR